MGRRPIGFLDSGVGGLPYLARVRELLPAEECFYLADRANFPYGTRSRDEVRRIVLDGASLLVNGAGAKLVVVACNTASVISLAELREAFNVPFVGVVPAIKPAAERAPAGRIGILATERTVEDPYLDDLVRRFAQKNQIEIIRADGLVSAVEESAGDADAPAVASLLNEVADEARGRALDVIVLGCTHFVHAGPALSALMGDSIAVVDSVEGVARQVARVCASGPETTDTRPANPVARVFVSGDRFPESYNRLVSRYSVEFVNSLPLVSG